MTGHAIVTQGDARALLLPDESVDLIVTSPPYFALRSYKDDGEHFAEQLGAEATPGEYIDALIECTREWLRVLKPTGSLWVNLGDKYNSAASGQNGSHPEKLRRPRKKRVMARGTTTTGLPVKSLIGLPWRYALRCIDELGLILRAEVIWSKPNGLPESVTDRVRRSHETWFHFVKQPKYFAAVDEIREPHHPESLRHERQARTNGRASMNRAKTAGAYPGGAAKSHNLRPLNPLGKLPGSVWTIATQPLKVPAELGIDHFAAFPMEWPKRLILGWSPSGICTACGEGRTPVSAVSRIRDRTLTGERSKSGASGLAPHGGDRGSVSREVVGERCACPDTSAPTTPAVVLDPFGGTGTTALMASVLGRVGISVDMSADYCRLAVWRTNDEKQLAKAREKCADSLTRRSEAA